MDARKTAWDRLMTYRFEDADSDRLSIETIDALTYARDMLATQQSRLEALEKEQSAWRKFTDEANRTLEAADKKIATLQARIEALEGGIREFIAKGHADNCLTFYILEKSAGKCDCGLDALAALLQEPTK